MLEKIKQLIGISPAPDYKQILQGGGIILDVRSKSEFAAGHIEGAKNIPVSDLESRITELKDNNRPVITCCASGMRSASAKSLLKSQSFTTVYNGGGWKSLQDKINKKKR